MRIVVALGGNALLRRGEPMTAENQRANVRTAADGARGDSSRQRAGHHPRQRPAGRASGAPGRGLRAGRGLSARRARRRDRGDDRLHDRAGARATCCRSRCRSRPSSRWSRSIPTIPASPIRPSSSARSTRPSDAERLQAEKGWTMKQDGDQLAPRRGVAAAQANLRGPSDALAARKGHDRHRAGGGGIPTVYGPDRKLQRRRGGHRQGLVLRAAGPRARRRSLHHGDGRRRRLRRLGNAGGKGVSARQSRGARAATTFPPARWARRSLPPVTSPKRPASRRRSAH